MRLSRSFPMVYILCISVRVFVVEIEILCFGFPNWGIMAIYRPYLECCPGKQLNGIRNMCPIDRMLSPIGRLTSF